MKRFDEEWELAKKLLETKCNCTFEDLVGARRFCDSFKGKYSTYNIFKRNCFSEIFNKARSDQYCEESLIESCIRRSAIISKLEYEEGINNQLLEEISQCERLWNVIEYTIIPLEVFWAMEYEYDDGCIFSKEEKIAFEHMKCIADIYLKESNELLKKFAKNRLK